MKREPTPTENVVTTVSTPPAVLEPVAAPAPVETPTEPTEAKPTEEVKPAVTETPSDQDVPDGSEKMDWGEFNTQMDTEDASSDLLQPDTVKEVTTSPPSTAVPAPAQEPAPKSGEVSPEKPVTAPEVVKPVTPAVPETPEKKPETLEVQKPPSEVIPKEALKPSVPELTPEQQAEEVNKVRNEQRQVLVQRYQISDEDAASFITAPNEVVPNMLAELHMSVLESSVQALAGLIPNMVSQVMERQKANTAANDAFFKAWPKLAKDEFQTPLLRMLSAYKISNPEVPQEQLIREVGAAAHLAFRLLPDDVQTPEVVQSTQVPSQQVFVPAVPGGARIPLPEKEKGKWENYNDELDTEEKEAQQFSIEGVTQ